MQLCLIEFLILHVQLYLDMVGCDLKMDTKEIVVEKKLNHVFKVC